MQDYFNLSGKRACVTGASSGLGRAMARGLAEAGAEVIGIARRAGALETWQQDCAAAGLTAHSLPADLGRLDEVAEIGERLCDNFGTIDILVNAAGLNPRQTAESLSLEDWQKTIDLNLSAPFLLARSLVPGMRAKGWGRIVNIASLQSLRAFPDGAAYGASKGGIAQLTRAMAEAWSKDCILCNAIAPGFFPTELTAPVFQQPEIAERLAAQTCIGRNGELDDLVGPLLFLASDASRYVTGQILFVDGGFTAK